MQGRYSKEQNETSLPLTCQGGNNRLHQKDKRKAVKWFVTDLSKIPLKDGSMDLYFRHIFACTLQRISAIAIS